MAWFLPKLPTCMSTRYWPVLIRHSQPDARKSSLSRRAIEFRQITTIGCFAMPGVYRVMGPFSKTWIVKRVSI